MENKIFSMSKLTINNSINKVWQMITTTETVQQFMLGMQPITTWEKGSEIRWRGRHQDNPDDTAKGVIVEKIENKQLSYTFYFPGYGYPDEPRYHNTVQFLLEPIGSSTELTVTQGDFFPFKEGETFKSHTQTFWDAALQKLKELAEANN